MSTRKLNPLRIATETVNAIAGTVQGIEMLRNISNVDITNACDLRAELHEAMKSIRWLQHYLKESASEGDAISASAVDSVHYAACLTGDLMLSSSIEVKRKTDVARPLKVLVPMIKDELEAGDAAGIEHYRRAGEMLIEAKGQLDHGEWMGWIKRNFHLSAKTSQRYMRLATGSRKSDAGVVFRTMSEAVEPTRPHHQVPWHQPLREITSRVNVAALTRERQDKEREQQMLRELAHQLVDIGYKVLAAKLHPDKGGSSEAMGRLNQVRSVLKNAI